jgi:hypothetical protein
MGSPAAMLSAYAEIVTRPAILIGEAIGLALLSWVAHRGRLYKKGPLVRFLRTGSLDPKDRGEGGGCV